ncbi:class I SAM-dependent methyltransferase [Cellulomonas soli]|uniref:SAM-dependent methyltransferase n=1 Tax=Cellulomonas soli TaxID=931535 RepID=A0A512PDP7_9CELL|nr:class I SAM-dependent methyltransferase [Cellulomonas soli]NYI60010.1 SAM-dependent methyltransferase [Cellulomonas soli]GEP69337.1 SAM-dependent methyltransferase [Cellulomonas soli]
MDADRTARAASFERGAAVYQATRPTYPAEAVRWCVPPGARDAVDLAAGTGKLTARLAELGLHVTALEPSDAMRGELLAAVPGVEARPGSAERTGLPDGVADVVTVAQAWHWFDETAASAEIARVLRPGGTLAVLWNVRDPDVDWVAAFTEIIHRGDDLEPSHRSPSLGPQFEPTEHTTIRWHDEIAPAALRALAASRSHLLTLPDADRDALLDAVDELVATHPHLRGRERVELPYLTRCWRARTRR